MLIPREQPAPRQRGRMSSDVAVKGRRDDDEEAEADELQDQARDDDVGAEAVVAAARHNAAAFSVTNTSSAQTNYA